MVAFTKGKGFSVVIIFLLLVGLLLTVTTLSQRQNTTSLAGFDELTCQPVPAEQVFAEKINQAEEIKTQQNAKRVSGELADEIAVFKQSTSATRSEAREKIRRTALARKKALIETMRQTPEKALEIIKDEKTPQELRTVTTNCVEEEETVEGELEILHVDFEDGTSDTQYTVVTDDKEEIIVHPVHDIHVDLLSGMVIRAKGYKLDNDILVDTVNKDNLIVTALQKKSFWDFFIPKTDAYIADSQGVQNVAVILVNFSNRSASLTTSQLTSNVFTTINNYYKEVSYGKTSLTGKVYGPYTLSIAATCEYQAVSKAAEQAANSQINFLQVDRVMVVAPFSGCGWAGLGIIGMPTVTSPDGTAKYSRSWLSSTAQVGSYGHELGHNFGVVHAAFLNCGTASFNGTCTRTEYGDPYDIMGVSRNRGHMNAVHKDKIGWFSTTNLRQVTQSGTYDLEPYETATQGIKALKISRGSGNGELYVEYRQPIGTDNSFTNSDVYNGILVHVNTRATGTDVDLIDAIPPASSLNPSLTSGKTVTDPLSGISILLQSKSTTKATVKVTIPGTSPAPSITPTPVSPSTYAIRGTVFRDTDLDNTKDASEPGVPGVTIRMSVSDSNGVYNHCCSTTTDSSGNYSVTDRRIGNWSILMDTADIPPGYTSSASNPRLRSITSGNIEVNFPLRLLATPTPGITVLPSVTPTRTPTPTSFLPTNTPTRTPTPTSTRTPTPTQPGATSGPTQPTLESAINLTIALQGIGSTGDTSNPDDSSLSNKNPVHPVRTVITELFDSENNRVLTKEGTINYLPEQGYYVGHIGLGNLPAKLYRIKVKTTSFLRKEITPPTFIAKGEGNYPPKITMISGDANDDNFLSIVDYNMVLDCYSDLAPARSCSNQKKLQTDFNDDGKVDQADYSIFLRTIARQQGE